VDYLSCGKKGSEMMPAPAPKILLGFFQESTAGVSTGRFFGDPQKDPWPKSPLILVNYFGTFLAPFWHLFDLLGTPKSQSSEKTAFQL